jgi:lipopolysaccharide export system permease protein
MKRDSVGRHLSHQAETSSQYNETTFEQPAIIDTVDQTQIVKNDSVKPAETFREKRLRKPVLAKGVQQSAEESKPTELPVTKKPILTDSMRFAKVDSIMALPVTKSGYTSAVNKARVVKSQLAGAISTFEFYTIDERVFRIQWHKILASSLACVAMFLIGAPLGAIIKKGGLGVPFLVSILFFIVYYLLTMTGEKWAKQGIVSVEVGVWAADVILLLVGLVFLRQARIDARLFEADFYRVVFDKVSRWIDRKNFRNKGK